MSTSLTVVYGIKTPHLLYVTETLFLQNYPFMLQIFRIISVKLVAPIAVRTTTE